MPSEPLPEIEPPRALRTLRIIWLALVAGVITFAAVVAAMVLPGNTPPTSPANQPDLATIFTVIAFAMLIVEVPLGYFIRNQTYKRYWRGDVVTPQGYVTGNLLLLAMLEGVAFFALVAILVTRTFGLVAVPGVIAFVLLLANLPNGKAMDPPTSPYETPLARR